MPRKTYDQRVMALVEVRGGERDWQEAERLFEARGWPIVEHWARDEAPIADDVSLGSDARLYKIEVRIFGSAWRAAIGAGWSVQVEARSACLDMYVHRADRVPIAHKPRPEWLVTWAATPPEPVTGHADDATGPSRAKPSHAFVTGHDRPAARLARDHPTAGEGSSLAVRKMPGFWDPSTLNITKRWPLMTLAVLLYSASSLSVALGRPDTAPYWASLASSIMLLLTPQIRLSELARSLYVLVVAGAVLMLCVQMFFEFSQISTWSQILVSVIFVLLYGLWLLMRQWSRGEWVAWLAPLTITLTASSLVGAAPLLHAWYAERFSLDTADLNIPTLWNFLAAVKVLMILAWLLIAPAAWGFIKHFHWVRPGGHMNPMIYAFLLAAFAVGVGAQVNHSVSQAVTLTKTAVHQHTAAPRYFGIRPEWVCLRPTVPVDELPVQGGRLDTGRSYLSLGAANGNLVLLHGSPVAPMKVPVADLQVVPVEPDVRTCP